MQKWRKFTLKFLIQFLNKYELILYKIFIYKYLIKNLNKKYY